MRGYGVGYKEVRSPRTSCDLVNKRQLLDLIFGKRLDRRCFEISQRVNREAEEHRRSKVVRRGEERNGAVWPLGRKRTPIDASSFGI